MSVGTLKLKRYNGIESFSVEKAEISYSKGEDGAFAVTLDGEAGAALSTLPDTVGLPASPDFEFTLLLPKAPQAVLAPAAVAFELSRPHDQAGGAERDELACEREAGRPRLVDAMLCVTTWRWSAASMPKKTSGTKTGAVTGPVLGTISRTLLQVFVIIMVVGRSMPRAAPLDHLMSSHL